MRRAQLQGQEVQPNTCGRLAVENDALAFWQSRMTADGDVPPLPRLTDIHSLAAMVREAFNEDAPCARL